MINTPLPSLRPTIVLLTRRLAISTCKRHISLNSGINRGLVAEESSRRFDGRRKFNESPQYAYGRARPGASGRNSFTKDRGADSQKPADAALGRPYRRTDYGESPYSADRKTKPRTSGPSSFGTNRRAAPRETSDYDSISERRPPSFRRSDRRKDYDELPDSEPRNPRFRPKEPGTFDRNTRRPPREARHYDELPYSAPRKPRFGTEGPRTSTFNRDRRPPPREARDYDEVPYSAPRKPRFGTAGPRTSAFNRDRRPPPREARDYDEEPDSAPMKPKFGTKGPSTSNSNRQQPLEEAHEYDLIPEVGQKVKRNSSGADIPAYRSTESETPSSTRGKSRSMPVKGDRKNSSSAPESTPFSIIKQITATSEWIYGRNAVIAVLKAKKRKMYSLYLHERVFSRENEDTDLLQELLALAEAAQVKVIQVEDDALRDMDRRSRWRPHNGCLLEADPLRFPSVHNLTTWGTDERGPYYNAVKAIPSSKEDSALARAPSLRTDTKPLIVLPFELLNAGNFGAFLRSTYWFGVDGVAIPERASAQVNAISISSSAGATEGLNFMHITDPVRFISQSKHSGWCIVAAMPPSPNSADTNSPSVFEIPSAGRELAELRKEKPIILLVGGEERGLPHYLTRHATHYATIKRGGKNELGIDSLNVSVASSLILSELNKPVGANTESADDSATESEQSEDRIF